MNTKINSENETEFHFILNVIKQLEQPLNDQITKPYWII